MRQSVGAADSQLNEMGSLGGEDLANSTSSGSTQSTTIDTRSASKGGSEAVIGESGVLASPAASVPISRPSADGDDQLDADNGLMNTRDWLEKRRQDLMREPKDDSWAYYMEQSITQFLSQHPGMVEFDISYVECRTITCQIQVIGFDRSTGPTWSRVMYDFGQHYPDQSHESGMSAYDLDGAAVFVQSLRRN